MAMDKDPLLAQGLLRTVDFVCASLLAGDVLASVFRHMLQAESSSTDQQPDDRTDVQSVPTTPQSADWYEIDAVLKRRKQNNRDLFLVKWKGTEETSWVKRSDLSPAAIQQYIKTHPRKGHRRG